MSSKGGRTLKTGVFASAEEREEQTSFVEGLRRRRSRKRANKGNRGTLLGRVDRLVHFGSELRQYIQFTGTISIKS